MTRCFRPYDGPADVVTMSHDHADHGKPSAIAGSPILIRGEGKFAAPDVEILGVRTYMTVPGDLERGANTVFIISADGLGTAHLGDPGHVLTADLRRRNWSRGCRVDCRWGVLTIDGKSADIIGGQIGVRIVVSYALFERKC